MVADDSVVLQLTNVHLRRGRTDILSGVSWRVTRGQHWAVVGPNGGGKTTMLKVACGSMWPSRGEVRALGHRYGTVDLRLLRRRIGWVSSALDEWIPAHEKARDVVLSGLYASFGIYETPDSRAVTRAADLLELLGCTALADRPYGVLSQGEQQRVLVARSLMTEAEILILDEAAAGLDISAREVLLEAVEKLAKTPGGPTLVFVTHHVEEIVPAITHDLALKSGKIVAAGEKDAVLSGPVLSETFQLPVEVDIHHGRYWPRVKAFGK